MDAFRSNLYDGLQGDQRRLVERLSSVAWLAVILIVGSFVLLDIGLVALIDDSVKRIFLRWLVVGGTCVLLTLTMSRRAIAMVAQSVRGERAARDEAEALARLVATIAAGDSIEDTLSAAVTAAAGLFGGNVRCTVMLPDAEGLLRVVAWNDESSAHMANFSFRPGEGFNGRAFSSGQLIRVDDLQSASGRRSDVGRNSSMRSLMAAPLIADRRTLGVLTAVSPTEGAFGAQQERVLTAVAGHVAVALVAAEAREAARREASEKAAIIDQMEDAMLVADKNRQIVACNPAAAALFDVPAEDLIGKTGATAPWRFYGADGVEISPGGQGPFSRALAGDSAKGEYRILTSTGQERWVWATATPLRAADGTRNGAILVLRDMADWRRTESALRESEERYRLLVELCPDPILVLCEGQVVYCNPATVALAGANSAEDIIGRSIVDLIQVGGLRESTLVRLDGDVIQIESTTMPITSKVGRRFKQCCAMSPSASAPRLRSRTRRCTMRSRAYRTEYCCSTDSRKRLPLRSATAPA